MFNRLVEDSTVPVALIGKRTKGLFPINIQISSVQRLRLYSNSRRRNPYGGVITAVELYLSNNQDVQVGVIPPPTIPIE
jgi:hypothetical protein